MFKLRLSLIAFAGIFTGLLAACDTGEVADTQGVERSDGATDAPQAAGLTGTPDRHFAGEPIPDVIVTDPTGTQLALAEAARSGGRPILLNLWATWCAPCVVEMPLLDDLAGDLGDTVRVLTVSEDLRGAEVVEPFFAEHGYANLPQWMDAQNELAFAFGGGAVLPLTILYDAQGREVWRVIGAYAWDSAAAREAIMEAMTAQDRDAP